MGFYAQKYLGLVGVTLLLFHYHLVSALHADEVGKLDYTIHSAGHGRHGVQYARLVANGTAILTSSSVPDLLTHNQLDGGCYLSSRNLWTGELLWRRDVCSMKNAKYAVCAPRNVESTDSQHSHVYTVDSRGLIRTWDDVTGQMVQERLVNENSFDDYDLVTPRFLGCDTKRSILAAVLSSPNRGDTISFINSKASSLHAEMILKNAKVSATNNNSIARFIHMTMARNIAGDDMGYLIAAFVYSTDSSKHAYTTLGQMSYVQLSSSANNNDIQVSKPLCRDPRSNTASIPMITSSVKVIEQENGSWSIFGISADGSKIITCNPDDTGSVVKVEAISPSWKQFETLDTFGYSPPLLRITGSSTHLNQPTQGTLSVGVWSLPDLMQGKRLEPDMLFDNIFKCHHVTIDFSTSIKEQVPCSPSTRVRAVTSPGNNLVEEMDIHDGPVKHVHIVECKPEIVTFLATTQSGGTYMLSFDASRNSGNLSRLKLHWTAEEAMASVSSSFFLDMSRSVAKHIEMRDDTEETVIESLTFTSRISSQIDSFKISATGGFLNQLHFITKGTSMVNESSGQQGKNDYTFGFAKIAVLLSHSYAKLMGTDTLSKGKLLWSLNLNPTAVWHKLVHGSLTSHSSIYGMGHYQPHSHEVLVLSSFTEHVEWSCIDLFRGRVLSHSSIPIRSPVVEVFPLYGITSNCRQGAIMLHEDHTVSVSPSLNETLIQSSSIIKSDGIYMLKVDEASGRIRSFYSAFQSKGDGENGFSRATIVGETIFDSSTEKILSLTFPEKNEIVQSPASILGDDSLLLKYLNPHICVVVTEATIDSFRSVVSEDGDSTSKQFYQTVAAIKPSNLDGKQKKPLGATNPGEDLQVTTDDSSSKIEPPPTLFINVIDTVSGQLLHRISHTHADLKSLAESDIHVPVVVSENWIVYAFPNYRSRRTEIGVLTMHEGMIDKNGLTAFKGPEQEETFSSITSPKPIVLSKTFGFSKPVSAIGVTQTKGGISAKNILFATGISGQVVRVDRRMLDPRRPVGEPKKSEKEEGLMQYAPIIPTISQWIVSYSNSIQAATSIVSSAANLESHTLMMVYGGPDIFFTRLAPSKGFDSLPETFNKLLLLLVMISLVASLRVIVAKSKPSYFISLILVIASFYLYCRTTSIPETILYADEYDGFISSPSTFIIFTTTILMISSFAYYCKDFAK